MLPCCVITYHWEPSPHIPSPPPPPPPPPLPPSPPPSPQNVFQAAAADLASTPKYVSGRCRRKPHVHPKMHCGTKGSFNKDARFLNTRANKLNDRYATLSAIAEKPLATVYSNIKIAGPAKFKIGDSVYVSKYKTIFEKGYIPNWRGIHTLPERWEKVVASDGQYFES
ncbi:hypothetical protein ALC53_03732 [Atta colombica]|uniref:Uncharacterized protein n=1 Tax=Atta colombica TaxID=520822 RepID=A0A151I527_9HYME|nr:hypothetical protein ALC53_03732 [Atta colombica]